MSAGKLAAVLGLVGLATVLYFRSSSRESHAIFEPDVRPVEAATPCPWREAETDTTNWFPGATKYSIRDLVLSGKRLQLQERLGRPLLPEEMALHCYPVLSNDLQIGTVLTRRLKGEHGAIEIALALDMDERIRHFKIQRIREPSETLEALGRCHLEAELKNKSFADRIVFNCPSLPESAKRLAEMLAGEVQALLILYEVGYSDVRPSHH